MTTKRSGHKAEHLKDIAHGRDVPDYRSLPAEIDPATVVETHDVEPDVRQPRSIWATPDLEDMARTNAIGGI